MLAVANRRGRIAMAGAMLACAGLFLAGSLSLGWAQPPEREPPPGEQPPLLEPAPLEPAPMRDPARDPLTERESGEEIPQLLRPLSELESRIKLLPGKHIPPDPAADFFARAGSARHEFGQRRDWPEQYFLWLPSRLCHYPLLFEEINLERYGYSCGKAQPLVSAAHFFGRLPAIPYLLTIDPPCRCKYVLGHYRPGSCAPMRTHLPPADVHAALVQGGTVTALVFLIP